MLPRYFTTAAPLLDNLRRLLTETMDTEVSATNEMVVVVLLKNSCSDPVRMPVYAVRVIVTVVEPVILVKRFRWLAPRVCCW